MPSELSSIWIRFANKPLKDSKYETDYSLCPANPPEFCILLNPLFLWSYTLRPPWLAVVSNEAGLDAP
jgi:hypothetical protein